MSGFTIAAKCAPVPRQLEMILAAGLTAVEIYTNHQLLQDPGAIISVCKQFPLRYAFHAPHDDFEPQRLADLAVGLAAEAAVVHPVYLEDEWPVLVKAFAATSCPLCVENTLASTPIIPLVRRFGVRRCIDFEHATMECAGVYVEAMLPFMRQAGHIHMTGYTWGSQDWHTHMHHAPEQSRTWLAALRSVGYTGLIVSEAKVEQQTPEEFRALARFAKEVETP